MKKDAARMYGATDPFQELQYRLEPDYSLPPLEIPADKRRLMLKRLSLLYGEESTQELYDEIARIIKVHCTYATPELNVAEEAFCPTDRFTEKAVAACGGHVSMKSNGNGTQSPYELNATWLSALAGGKTDEPLEREVARFIASRAIALVLRGVPAIYLPSMFGSENDTDAVCRGESYRSINRTAIEESKLFDTFADPESIHTPIAKRYIDLLEVRTQHPAFHPNANQEVFDVDPRVFAIKRTTMDGEASVLCLINVSEEAVPLRVPAAVIGLAQGDHVDLVSDRTLTVDADEWTLALEPYQVVWLAN